MQKWTYEQVTEFIYSKVVLDYT